MLHIVVLVGLTLTVYVAAVLVVLRMRRNIRGLLED